MHITIINDCRDENAKGRQVARAHALFGGPVTFIGVRDDLEAAGCLIDTLDVHHGDHAVLVNVAPRHGDAKRWENGTPFSHVRVGAAHVFASVGGRTLSLLKKLGLAESVELITYRDESFTHSQFRSLTYLPSVAHRVLSGEALPTEKYLIPDLSGGPHAWFVDNFGNIKTTLTNKEVVGARSVEFFGHTILLYPRLADIPDGALGAAVGSSGYGDTRFVELYVQGTSAARELGLV